MTLGRKQSMDIIIIIITIIIIIINNNGEGGVGLMTDLKRNEGIRKSSTLEDGIVREMIRALMEKGWKVNPLLYFRVTFILFPMGEGREAVTGISVYWYMQVNADQVNCTRIFPSPSRHFNIVHTWLIVIECHVTSQNPIRE